jgi:nodulation protein E
MQRVVITGQGALCALGRNAAQIQAAMREGVDGVAPMQFRDVERLSHQSGGQIKGYVPQDIFTRQQIVLYDVFTQFALLAAEEAIGQAGLEIDEAEAHRAGAILGTAGGGLQTQDENFKIVYEDAKNRVHPFVVPRLMNNAPVGHISMKYNLQGPSYTVATACASSNHAIGQAFHMIRAGLADVMITGGSESMLCFGGIKAWEGLRVMTRDKCRPFSKNRSGMVQGEGAAVFVLESLERAQARGADIIAEIVGFAATSDASDIVMPNQLGAERAMAGALRDGGINPQDVGYINAHGTGTSANDRTECAAVRTVFGGHAEKLSISSTKSMHGHLIGGTGAVELLACLLALREGVVAPTINYEEPDPECDLDVVPNTAKERKVDTVLSNAFAFGGLNAVLALRSF